MLRSVIVNYNSAVYARVRLSPIDANEQPLPRAMKKSTSLRRFKMKPVRCVLSVVVLMSLYTMAFAQSEAHKMEAPKTPAPKSEAQISFDTIKTLAGEWEGPVKTDMPEAMKARIGAGADIKPVHLSMRVTSRGNVLAHEF